MDFPSFKNEAEFDTTRIQTKVLLETSFSKEIQILLPAGQVMREHKTPFPILIHLLEGSIDLGVEGKNHPMKAGNIIFLEGGILHDLSAKENAIIRLTLSKPDDIERLKEVLEVK